MRFAKRFAMTTVRAASLPLVSGLLGALLCLGGCWPEADATSPSSSGESPRADNTETPQAPDPCDRIAPAFRVGRKLDGTLATTAHEVWPSRIDEGAPLSADEHLQACALLAACRASPDGTDRAELFSACLAGGNVEGLGWFFEERAVPTPITQLRWAARARQILASKGSCEEIGKPDKEFDDSPSCEEDGCKFACVDPGKVLCSGTVAVFSDRAGHAHTRDCADTLAACDPDSPTGCTDRTPVLCDHPATDACDGDIRLGCDGSGRVSFHDCARIPGGTCQTIGGVGRCVRPDAGECEDGLSVDSCADGLMSACFLGKKHQINCGDLGLRACVLGTCTQ
jgi:hypothetical protein